MTTAPKERAALAAHDAAPWRAVQRPARRGRGQRGDGQARRAESPPPTWPRLKTSARWQMRSTSSKSDEISSTASPLLQRELQQMVDLRLGADVDADGRLLENEQLDLRLHPARDHHLLLIAAGQRRDRLARRPPP